ncbi:MULTISPECIES: DNA recombination protein RmuC [Sphingomonas]|jgi:DNA recombination protein RmuC|uniref:DNA recombination protein RmuC homolog n=1 Tax=Sphingomonas aerolata TaxID=185951 RepID=A0A2T4YNC6_9SPHN|nr:MULTISPECIES: DNA recombination protein RmuC [Sphingomonas]MBD8471308.1 DNA recombination protein RmuC [Sphingomonas sp. CFBP 8765]MBD8638136.1 DNA recombination protein RmuC [Sphingomonas sp. CFBP 13733]PTM44898.1 DNA recombination protein RmuC [Sphingomonas aerolata]
MTELVIVALLAAAAGLLLGWLLASRRAGALASDLAVARTRAADYDLVRTARDAVEQERNAALQDLATLRAQNAERAGEADRLRTDLATIRADRDAARTELATEHARSEAFEARLVELRDAKDVMAAQFGDVANKLLSDAQKTFLDRADARFRQSEESAGQNLKSMLQPVSDRLQRYEEGVAKVEAERRDAFGDLKGQIEQMRLGQEKVSTEAAKLVNSLRNAPKSRGRWGEQQLKNVLETCGLSEHTDFQTEVSVAVGDADERAGARLRPDAIIRVPGGRALVIDAKVSLNAYQDAFGAVDEAERLVGLAAHAASMRAHVNGLGNKAYWSQFADTPDYVIMFVPGEHFLSAALEHDPTLWDFAFEKRVLLATPTNLIAIARTVAAVWRQEKLANEARKIGELGKEMHDRLAKVADDLRKVGVGLNSAVKNFNGFTNSFNGRLMVTGRKFRDLNIETGARDLEDVSSIDALALGEGPALIEKPETADV